MDHAEIHHATKPVERVDDIPAPIAAGKPFKTEFAKLLYLDSALQDIFQLICRIEALGIDRGKLAALQPYMVLEDLDLES